MRCLKTFAWLLVAAAAAGTLAVYFGVYDVASVDQHTRPVYWLLKANMRRAIHMRARNLTVPALDDAAMKARGLALYREHCVRCHGAPGEAPEPFALGLNPPPENLAHSGREWPAQDLFWTAKYGLKMTGMPAWEYRLTDEKLWQVVAFLKALPGLSPSQYREAKGLREPHKDPAPLPPDATRGKQAIYQYGCATCHLIPGIVGATLTVGPPLEGMARRVFIAGVLPNSQDNMERWLRNPPAVKPGTAMPNLRITERDARDIAVYVLQQD